MSSWPNRIVCLTEETTEALYMMGEQDRIVGISGYTVRPPQARKEKPKVSAFTSARIDKILALEPDLVLGFSDMQAAIAAELVRCGIEVHIFNQRSVDGIYRMLLSLSAMIGQPSKGEALVTTLQAHISDIQATAAQLPRRPKVYFEEWYDPLISGIGWVSELIHIAGGEDCFGELAQASLAQQRIIQSTDEVVARAPDIILGSWCGRKFQPQKLAERPGWQQIPAIANQHVYEIKSADILQPGPAALTDGVHQMHHLFQQWSGMI